MFRFTPGCCCVLGSGSDSGSESGSGSGSSGSEELSGSSGSAGSIEQGSVVSGSDSGSSGSESGSDDSGSESGSLESGSTGSDESGSSGSESGSAESGSSGSAPSGSSGPSIITVPCCENGLSTTLVVTPTGACLIIDDYPAVYQINAFPLLDGWKFTIPCISGGSFTGVLYCDGSVFRMAYENGLTNTESESSDCDPLEVVVEIPDLGLLGCGGTCGVSSPHSFTFTEPA